MRVLLDFWKLTSRALFNPYLPYIIQISLFVFKIFFSIDFRWISFFDIPSDSHLTSEAVFSLPQFCWPVALFFLLILRISPPNSKVMIPPHFLLSRVDLLVIYFLPVASVFSAAFFFTPTHFSSWQHPLSFVFGIRTLVTGPHSIYIIQFVKWNDEQAGEVRWFKK